MLLWCLEAAVISGGQETLLAPRRPRAYRLETEDRTPGPMKGYGGGLQRPESWCPLPLFGHIPSVFPSVEWRGRLTCSVLWLSPV